MLTIEQCSALDLEPLIRQRKLRVIFEYEVIEGAEERITRVFQMLLTEDKELGNVELD